MPAARTTTAAPGGYRRAQTSRKAPAQRQRQRQGQGQRSRSRRQPSRRTPLRIRWERVGRVVLLVVLAVVLGLYIQQGIAYLSVRSQSDEAAAAVQRLSHQNAELRHEEKRLNNPTTIVEEARQLGMIKPGEKPYVVTGLPGG